MRLNDFLEHHDNGFVPGRVVEHFAKRVGCSIYAVRKWLSGERIPRPRHQRRIYKLTGGKVSSADWIGEGD